MSSGPGKTHQAQWLARARQTSRQVNLGWWLESLSTPLLALALVGAAALLLVRRDFPQTAAWIPAAYLGGGVVLLGVTSRILAARKFEKPEQSLVRIEAVMRLRNALSAANAGVAPWPAPLAKINADLSWQWPRLLVPPLGALLLLAAGWFIPVSSITPAELAASEQPQAWRQLNSELDHLMKEEVVDEKYLEETRKRLDELKTQDEEQWFSHSSLEATDSLKKSHRAETSRVERELGRAEKALANLEKNASSTNQAEKNRLMEEFDQALQGLQNGAMRPNPKLLEQMKQLDLAEMAKITPEQMVQLRENLKKMGAEMKNSQTEGGEDWSDELLAGDGEEKGEDGEGESERPGSGGSDRGPGHDPKVLGREKDAIEIGEVTGLKAKDLSKSMLGDLLELQDGEHEVDRTTSRESAGGATEATGKGGDRVWRDALDPAEQRTLKRFFE